jgi:hypothetical protein
MGFILSRGGGMAEHQMNVDLGGGHQTRIPVDYPSNSRKNREAPRASAPDPKNVEKIITGKVLRRKKRLSQRVGQSFLAEDIGDGDGILEFIVTDVLIPAAKHMIYDAFTMGLERSLWGIKSRIASRSDRPGGYMPYNRVRRSPSAAEYGQHVLSPRTKARHEFDDLILMTRGEAEEVLDQLIELIELYDQATIADLYSLVGQSGEFTDNKWGWYDLSNASVRHVRGGYMLVLPRTQAID